MDYQLDNGQEKKVSSFFLLYLVRNNHHGQHKQLKALNILYT